MIEARTSLVIPAYNEATRIGAVIEAGLGSSFINEVIVVDDGSIDATAKAAIDYGTILLQHSENQGKGEAMQTGYLHAKALGSTALLFLDSDLHGLKPDHIDSLVRPVVDEGVPMAIGILDRTRLQKTVLKRWGALSGQRALHITAWEQLDERGRSGFNVEAALNVTARIQGWHRDIRRIELGGVTHTGQREKAPNLVKAGLSYARIYGAAALTYVKMELRQ